MVDEVVVDTVYDNRKLQQLRRLEHKRLEEDRLLVEGEASPPVERAKNVHELLSA